MLLTETDEKVAIIALDSGFTSLSAFYEAFSKANGISPAHYRAKVRRSSPLLSDHNVI